MSKVEKDPLNVEISGQGPLHISARERTVPRSSAKYVYSGGKGEAAYKLMKIIEGNDKRFSQRFGKNLANVRVKVLDISVTDRDPRKASIAVKQPNFFGWKVFGGGPKRKLAERR